MEPVFRRPILMPRVMDGEQAKEGSKQTKRGRKKLKLVVFLFMPKML